MNFLQLIKRVWRECGYQGSGPSDVASTVLKDARLIGWVKQAYADIQNRWIDWDFLWVEYSTSTVADQRDYTPPSTLNKIMEDTVTLDDDVLEYIPWTTYRRDRSVYDESDTGEPTSFTIKPDGSLRLFPTPDAVYTLGYEYYRTPFVMSASTDVPAFSERHYDTIIWRAKMLCAIYEEAQEQVQASAALYEDAMRRLEATSAPSVDGHNGRLSGVDIVVRPH